MQKNSSVKLDGGPLDHNLRKIPVEDTQVAHENKTVRIQLIFVQCRYFMGPEKGFLLRLCI